MQLQTPIRQKRPNFSIPYFRPFKCRPSLVPPGAHVFIHPLPASTVFPHTLTTIHLTINHQFIIDHNGLTENAERENDAP